MDLQWKREAERRQLISPTLCPFEMLDDSLRLGPQNRSLKLSSSISKGHNVGEINWRLSASKVVKFMPRKFLDCLSSAWLKIFIAERSQITQ